MVVKMETSKQRILVCVAPSLSGRKLIHIASQMASLSGASLSAVSVIGKHDREKHPEICRRCMDNLNYAKELGAGIQCISGHDIAGLISAYARSCGAAKLVLGRSAAKKTCLFRSPCLAEKLKRLLPGTEIVTIPNPEPVYDEKEPFKKLHLSWKDAGVSLGILAAASLLCRWFYGLGFTDATLITVYIFAVLLISFLTSGYLCGALSSLLSVLIFNFFFTVPLFSLKSYGTGYPVTLVVMFLSAFLTSYLTSQVRRQAQQHAQNAYRTEMLLGANRRLQHAMNENEILQAAAEQIGKLLVRSVLLYPVRSHALAGPILIPAGETLETLTDSASQPKERQIAEWTVKNNMQAGATTGIFDDAEFWYVAVRINDDDEACAVAGIRMEKDEQIDPFDKNLLLAMLGECAVALEKERLDRAGEEYAIQIKQEQIRSNLLRSISHDLRTPLTAISGNATMLMNGAVPAEQDRQQIYEDIYDDSVWLIDLVENLLSITRIDNGHLNIHLQPQDVSDLLDAAASHIQSRKKNHSIRIIKPAELLMVNADCSLLVQMLDNLIENAFKYAGENSSVEISAKSDNGHVILLVSDDGPGIPDAEKEKVFDMFYTAQNRVSADGRLGLGLGLSLCRIIAQEHGGTIRVYDRKPHGAVFEVTLPTQEAAHE